MNEIKVKKKSVESGNIENVTLDKIKALADQALKIIPARVEYFARIIGVTYGNMNHQKSENKMGKLQQQREFEF